MDPDRRAHAGTHVVVLPGGGYAEHAPHEGEPVAEWLRTLGFAADVCPYPLLVRHPAPLNALRRKSVNSAAGERPASASSDSRPAATLPVWPRSRAVLRRMKL